MENMKGVIFDLDDVLLDTASNLDWLNKSFRRTLAEYGITRSRGNLQKIQSKNLYRFDRISKEFGIQSDELWETRNRNYIQEKMKAMKNRELIFFPDVNSLYKLKEKYTLAIVSDSPQEIVEFFVKEFGYKDLFECVIGRGSKLEDLQKLKPSSHPFSKLMENMQCERLFYVGDSRKDCEFAENNGMEFILLSRRENKEFNCLDKVVDYLLS